MEYTLFQDFARKILRPAPPTGRLRSAQSGHTPGIWLRALIPRWVYMLSVVVKIAREFRSKAEYANKMGALAQWIYSILSSGHMLYT